MNTEIYKINTEIKDGDNYYAWITAEILMEHGSYDKRYSSILFYDAFACDCYALNDLIIQFHKECYSKLLEIRKDSVLMFPPMIYYHDDVGSKIIKRISPILNQW